LTRRVKEGFGAECVTATGAPSFRSIVMSVFVHGMMVAGLGSVSLVSAPPPPKNPPQIPNPTQIRIGDRLYFVARISPPQQLVRRAPDTPAAPAKLTSPVAPAPVRAAVEPPAPRPVESHPAIPRAFIPPELRRDPISDRTLIQPMSPADLIPPNVDLPSFRVFTAQLPKTPPKTFVAPGRRNPPPPNQVPPPPTPENLEFVHADPVPNPAQAALVLPAPPPPLADPPKVTDPAAKPPSPQGDPVNILSINGNSVPATDTLVVPPGNMVGKTGEGTTSTSGAPAADAAGRSTADQVASAGGSPGAPGSGRPTDPAMRGSATGSPGGVVVVAGAAPAAPRTPPGATVFVRPATGEFDAVVVQTSPLDQFPEGRNLLSGRPIYSVYISIGAAKEWAFFFCVPEEKPATGSPTPVRAPFPTRLVRPALALPSYQKYVLVHGFVTTAGRFQGMRVVGAFRPDMADMLLASLNSWEFRAATRDGVPIAVEVLLSIPSGGL
jgi:hypothetical protein